MINKEKLKTLISDKPSHWQEKAEWQQRNEWWLCIWIRIQIKYYRFKHFLKNNICI